MIVLFNIENNFYSCNILVVAENIAIKKTAMNLDIINNIILYR